MTGNKSKNIIPSVVKPRAVLSPVRGTKHSAVYDFDVITGILQKLGEIPLPYNVIAPIITTIQNAQVYPVEQLNEAIQLFNSVDESEDDGIDTPESITK